MIITGRIKEIMRDTKFGYYIVAMESGEVYRCNRKIVEDIFKKLPLIEMRVEKKHIHTHIEVIF